MSESSSKSDTDREDRRDFDLQSDEFFVSPNVTLRRLRSLAPVYYHERLGAWFLTSHEDVSSVVMDTRFSVGRGGRITTCDVADVQEEVAEVNRFLASLMVFSDPPRHTRLRRPVSEIFGAQGMTRIRPSIVSIVDELLAPLLDELGEIDLVSRLAEPIPIRATACLLGLSVETAVKFKTWTNTLFRFTGARVADEATVRASYHGLCAARDSLAEILATGAYDKENSVIGVLQDAGNRTSIDDDDFLGLIMALIGGAYEAPIHLLSHAVVALMEHREQWEELCATPSLAADAVQEALRFDGPAFAVQRIALEDVVIRDQLVGKGDRVYAVLHAANHDPAVFPDPERFDIHRRPARQLGLSYGIHYCVGAAFARLLGSVTLECLARSLPDLELGQRPLERYGNYAMRGMKRLFVRPHGAVH